MTKHLKVRKDAFDSALSRLIGTKPIEREAIKTDRKKPAKLIAKS